MASAMEPVFEQRTGWKRIYPDLPGMGKTPGATWITTQDQMLDLVIDFVDQVIPGQRFVLAGGSYGGYLARGMVYRRPALLNGLFLVVPVIRRDDAISHLPLHVTLVADPALLAEMDPDLAQAFQQLAVVQIRKLLDWAKENMFPAFAIADHKFLRKLRQHYTFSFDVDKLPEPFIKPTLILTGRQDSNSGYIDAWGIVKNFPRATFVVLDRAGHALGIEQEALTQALVSEWLDRVEEGIGSQY
jgi:pimeloyl-ACP methyl ester carboxylesterase